MLTKPQSMLAEFVLWKHATWKKPSPGEAVGILIGTAANPAIGAGMASEIKQEVHSNLPEECRQALIDFLVRDGASKPDAEYGIRTLEEQLAQKKNRHVKALSRAVYLAIPALICLVITFSFLSSGADFRTMKPMGAVVLIAPPLLFAGLAALCARDGKWSALNRVWKQAAKEGRTGDPEAILPLLKQALDKR